MELEDRLSRDQSLRDGVGLWVGLVVGIGSIGIDRSYIRLPLIEEVQTQGRVVWLQPRERYRTNQLLDPFALRAAVMYSIGSASR